MEKFWESILKELPKFTIKEIFIHWNCDEIWLDKKSWSLNYKHLLKFNDITPFWSPLLSAVKVQNIELCQIVVNKMNKYYEQIQMKWCPCTFAIMYASSENLTKSFQFLYQFSKSYEHIKICKGFGFGGYLNPRHESSKVKNLVYAISKVSVLEPLKIILADGV